MIAVQNLPHATQRRRSSINIERCQAIAVVHQHRSEVEPTNTAPALLWTQANGGLLLLSARGASKRRRPRSVLSEDDKEDLKLAHLRNYADIDNARCRVGRILRRCIQSTCFPHAASRKSNATRPKFEAAEMLANALCVTSGV